MSHFNNHCLSGQVVMITQQTPVKFISKVGYLLVIIFVSYHLVEDFGHETDHHRGQKRKYYRKPVTLNNKTLHRVNHDRWKIITFVKFEEVDASRVWYHQLSYLKVEKVNSRI